MMFPEYPGVFDEWWLTEEGQAVAEIQYKQHDDWLTPTEAAKLLYGESMTPNAGRLRLRYYVLTGRLKAYAKPESAGYRYNAAQREKRGSQSRSRTWVLRKADVEEFVKEYAPELMEPAP